MEIQKKQEELSIIRVKRAGIKGKAGTTNNPERTVIHKGFLSGLNKVFKFQHFLQ